ncbi:hypothetical protein Tco_0996051, partial [Tanacetum coccineum]
LWYMGSRVKEIGNNEDGNNNNGSMKTFDNYNVGRPIMPDTYTSVMCIKSWGRSDYARALIEMPFENVPVDSLVVTISFNDGPEHTMETIDVEYEWQPSRCVTCKTFGRNNDQCPKKTKVAGLDQVLGDGLVEVTRKQGKGKQHTKPKQIGGIWLTKLKLNYFYRPISTYANDHGEASTSLPKGHVDAVDTQI